MATQTADLDWDHSVGENLLPHPDDVFDDDFDTLAFYNGSLMTESMAEDHDSVKLSRRHLSFLMRSLAEATSLLREQHNLQNAIPSRTQPSSRTPERSKCRQSCDKVFAALTKFNLLITLALQTVMLIVVTIIDSEGDGKGTSGTLDASEWPTYFVMIFIGGLTIFLVIYISVQLTKTLIQSRATAIMLAQAYLSTVTMFAGLYVITYRMNKKGWTLHGFNTAKDDEVLVISYLYLKMLYHSISTSTLCGASTIHPDIWYNFILMALQMLLSFLYFASILRLITGPPQRKRPRTASPRLRRNPSMASLASTEQVRLLNGSTPTARYGGL